MLVSVLVPAYKRPDDLQRCVRALLGQSHPAVRIVITVRKDDLATAVVVDEMSARHARIKRVTVVEPGVVHAMNAGMAAAEGEILALTDDDAEPAEDWLQRIVETFATDSRIGGVGGRDEQRGVLEEKGEVGRVQWYGRVIGNHHIGSGPPRDVDVLKGVNCAFRLAALEPIGFDRRLRGGGAQMHWELSLGLALRAAGWRLVYDPAIRVIHHVSQRHDADQLHRGRFDVAPHEAAVFNETLILTSHLRGARGAAFRTWAALVGTAEAPGLLQLPRVLMRDGLRTGFARWRATQRSRAL